MIKRNRIITILIILTFMTLSTSCESNEEQTQVSIIKEAELTEKEEVLIKGTGINHSFVFEYKNNDNYDEIDIWIEKYQDGEKIGPMLKTSNPIDQESEKYIMFNISNVQDNSTWSISFIEGKNISTGKIGSNNNLGRTSTWEIAKNLEINKGEHIIAVLVGNDGNTINGIPNDFFSQPDEYIDEVLINDYVYLLKIKLY